jgi:predicted metal-dependent phosphotriesterase family hydrolase
VYIGHSNADSDLDYLPVLLDKGVCLGMDRCPGGRVKGPPIDSEEEKPVR